MNNANPAQRLFSRVKTFTCPVIDLCDQLISGSGLRKIYLVKLDQFDRRKKKTHKA